MSFHEWVPDNKTIDTKFHCDYRISFIFFIAFGILKVFFSFKLSGLEEFETLLRHDQRHNSICFVFLIHDIDDFYFKQCMHFTLILLHVCQSTSSMMCG